MTYTSPKSARVDLTREEYRIIDRARDLLVDICQSMHKDKAQTCIIYDEETDCDSDIVSIEKLDEVTAFLGTIV